MKRLVNVVTLCNLFSGFLSLVMAADGETAIAAWMIILALVCDSLDGKIARFVNHTTEFGKELDSLSDIVSFVVAPAFLLTQFFVQHLSPDLLLVLFAYLSAGAFRLARFNINSGSPKNYFQGLPTPAAATFIASTLLACIKNDWTGQTIFGFTSLGIVLGLSALMVGSIRYPKLSTLPFSQWRSLLYAGFITMLVVTLLANIETALATVLFIFILVAPFYASQVKRGQVSDLSPEITN